MEGRKRPIGFGKSDEPRRGTTALFVRIPTAEAEKLDRAAFELKRSKQDLVTALVARYVDPTSPAELRALGADADQVAVGRHSFRPVSPLEVLTPADLAALLQVEEEHVLALAESGGIPGRKVGDEWRFARAAVLEWLGASG